MCTPPIDGGRAANGIRKLVLTEWAHAQVLDDRDDGVCVVCGVWMMGTATTEWMMVNPGAEVRARHRHKPIHPLRHESPLLGSARSAALLCTQ